MTRVERRAQQSIRLYNSEDVAKTLTEAQPFFKMYSGGVYAVALNKFNKPANFLRMDKDRRPVKERKAARRAAREAK